MSITRNCAFVLFTLLGGASAAAARESIPIYATSAFSEPPAIVGAALSPRGTRLVTIVSVDRRYALRIRSGDGATVLGTIDAHGGDFHWARWLDEDRILASASYTVRSKRRLVSFSRLVSIAADGSSWVMLGRRSLTPKVTEDDRLISLLPNDRGHVLVSLYRSTEQRYPSVYKADVLSGSIEREQASRAPITSWIADRLGRVRIGIGYSGRDMEVYWRDASGGAWRLLRRADSYEEPAFLPVVFGSDDDTLYVISDHASDRQALYKYDLVSRSFSGKIFEHPRYDVAGTVVSADTYEPVGVSIVEDYEERIYFDPMREELQRSVDAAFPGLIARAVSSDESLDTVIVFARSPSGAGAYYLRAGEGAPRLLGRVAPQIDDRDLAQIKPLRFSARDGLPLEGYLTMPKGARPENLPVVVFPHGGPRLRDQIEYNPFTQFLANRGYAVFQVNFRGSPGYGRRHRRSGDKQWGLAIQDDISDGVAHLIEQGVADPRRLCIVGGSFGGYAALMGAVRTPDLYRCAASLNGVVDIRRWLNESGRFDADDVLDETVGNPLRDRQRLDDASPLYNIEAIRIPILIAYGDLDPLVSQQHALRMAAALARAGQEYTLLRLEGGDHSLSRPEARARFLDELDAFLCRHLGPGVGESIGAAGPADLLPSAC